jgi:predicted ATPase
VWQGLVVEENNLQVQVSALRKILGPTAIATVPGRGYRLALPGMPGTAGSTTAPLPGRLPAAPPPLVGRDAERLALVEQVRAQRLVTLVGPGGIGKTCLALAAAADLAPAFDDGVRLAELAAVSDPALLAPVVALALQLTLPPGDPAAMLATALRSHRLLLLIDNAEHLVDAVAALAVALLAQAPGVHLLVTSQVWLHVAGEQVRPLPPLGLPAADEAHPDERFGALQLFVQRARAVQPDFRPGDKEAALVAEICRQLDGLPLAIELAAARVRLLGLQVLRDRLHDGLPHRLRLLAGGARDAPQRQRTLQATLAWSHALLGANEQAVLRWLGVCVGGFTLELAQQVAADDPIDAWAVLEALSGLVDKSLVAVDGDDPPRYRLLETTRAFALERLAEAGEAAATAARHAAALRDLFLAMDAQRLDDAGEPDSDAMQARLITEVGNVRAALAWALGPAGDRRIALGLATGSAHLFMTIGQTLEALPWLLALRPADDEALPPARWRSSNFWILPVLVLGMASKRISRGTL